MTEMQGSAAAGNVPTVPDFKRLFESGPNLYLVLTPQWIIVAVSDAMLRATRITREEVIGRYALDVYPANPADVQSRGPTLILESLQRVIATRRPDVLPFQRYDIARPVCEGGYEERHWSIVNAPIFDDDGRVEFILERVEDVTDLVKDRQSMQEKSAELAQRATLLELDVAVRSAELRKANRELHRANTELNSIRADLERRIEERTIDLQRRNSALEAIAYAASHDLQEPLRAVAGYCQLLLMDFKAQVPLEAADYLEKAAAGAHRMSGMLKGILQFARMPQDSALGPLDANDAFMEALTSLQTAISESHATVIRGELPTIQSDRVLLAQLFQNLIGNSIKYHGDRPPVVMVNARHAGAEWIFTVSDNGIGIPVDSRQRVFGMFQRLRGPSHVPGTGIGLALCRQIVERHGGRIWIEGEEGQGATVNFTIPIRDDAR
jgi:signal transduction histidine kinase